MAELGKNYQLQAEVGWDRYDVVIVTTWELAARAYRYREALIYDLTELSSRGVTVVIYSTTSTEPQARRADRAGIGKLGVVSTNIISIAKQYHSNIGLTLADIREAARQSWPEAYDEFVAQQERKKKVNSQLSIVDSQNTTMDSDSHPTTDYQLSTIDLQSAQLSDRKINELGTLQPGFAGEEWEAFYKTSGDSSLALRMTGSRADDPEYDPRLPVNPAYPPCSSKPGSGTR